MKLFYFPNGLTILVFIFSLSFFENAFSQVGIGTTNPDSNSKLDINLTVAVPGYFGGYFSGGNENSGNRSYAYAE